MKIKESEIRENIAKNLNALDPNLRLVSQEYCISMPDGKRAYIDILAKDNYGCFTIIEIKKSNQSARSAIQQLFKYANFLKKKNRLEESQIRCFIISTVWDELMAPFSEFCHFSAYECKGYKLKFSLEERPIFDLMNPAYESGDFSPINNFIFFEFDNEEYRNKVQEKFEIILKSLPSLNCVLIKVDYEGEDDIIINPYGFAWVLYTGSIDNIRNELLSAYNIKFSDELFDPDQLLGIAENETPETIIRAEILAKLFHIEEGRGEINVFLLHSLNNTLSLWRYHEPIGFGSMFNDALFDSNDLISMSCGFLGTHPYNFVANTTPSRPKQFEMIRRKIDAFLIPNKRWRKQVNYILSSLDYSESAEIRIFNPLNIFGTINDISKSGSSTRSPTLYINILKNDNSIVSYWGSLFWSEKVDLLPPAEAVRRSYPDINVFMFRCVSHGMNQYDESLSNLCGLFYDIVCEIEGIENHLVIDNGYYKWEEFDTNENLQKFIRCNDYYVDEIENLYQFLK